MKTINGTPFLLDGLTIKESSFKDDFKIATIHNNNGNTTRGDGTSFNKVLALKGAMGELLERVTQTKLSHKIKVDNIQGYNIKNDEIVTVSAEEVLLVNSNLYEELPDNYWSDSSGTAFHRNSYDVIDSSFLEFIERQSLVFNWLTKTPGENIIVDRFLKGKGIETIYRNLKSYFNDIFTFNISISQHCYVIITIATGPNIKSVGLGAGWTIESALYKSLKETWQLTGDYKPNHFPELHPTNLLEPYLNETSRNGNIYHDYFASLSKEEVLEEYNYLSGRKNNSVSIKKNQSERPSEKLLIKKLKDIGDELSTELIIVYIPSIIEEFPGIVVKILGNGAFPHIKTDIINPLNYTINGINKRDVPNQGRMVPFS
ncbi:YcaO-like family protein [Peribacillus sp. SCS-26]|uniref:YcaO-like family protein n=1 Tax=Paraperibacillus marinus TaxID=3115295 RepID=UPI0039062BE3